MQVQPIYSSAYDTNVTFTAEAIRVSILSEYARGCMISRSYHNREKAVYRLCDGSCFTRTHVQHHRHVEGEPRSSSLYKNVVHLLIGNNSF